MNKPRENLQIWYCENCQNVHLKTKNVLLDFTRNEFVSLSEAMFEILQNNFSPLDLNEISDDVLMSEIVS